jgi:transcriptional regulator with XRE-family HTH domain
MKSSPSDHQFGLNGVKKVRVQGNQVDYLGVMALTSFGDLLATARRERRISQGELSAQSGVSQRHISFLETGRSAPGHAASARLIDALRLSQPEANRLLAAAGLRGFSEPLHWDDRQLDTARRMVHRLLENADPFPAIAIDRSGHVLLSNRAFERVLKIVPNARLLWKATCGARPRNLFDLTLHPAGIIQWLCNADEVVPHVVHRLRSAAQLDDGAAATWDRVRRFPAVTATAGKLRDGPPDMSGLVAEHYRVGNVELRFVSVSACFGSPEVALAQSVQLETYVPADDMTTSWCDEAKRTNL